MERKSQYKVLRVSCMFDNVAWLYGDDLDDETVESVIKHLEEERFQRITPKFNRDGWYYDRKAKFSWYEWRGTAWTHKDCDGQFLYELGQHRARFLEPEELKAIKTLIVYHSCPRILLEMLHAHHQKVMLRDIYRDARRIRIQMLKEEKELHCTK